MNSVHTYPDETPTTETTLATRRCADIVELDLLIQAGGRAELPVEPAVEVAGAARRVAAVS